MSDPEAFQLLFHRVRLCRTLRELSAQENNGIDKNDSVLSDSLQRLDRVEECVYPTNSFAFYGEGMRKGRTWIHDRKTGVTYVGSFEANHYQTAHDQLAENAGLTMLERQNCVAGSIKGNKRGYRLEGRSESINQFNDLQSGGRIDNVSCGHAHGNSLRPVRRNLEEGTYLTISPNGSKNRGRKKWGFQNQ